MADDSVSPASIDWQYRKAKRKNDEQLNVFLDGLMGTTQSRPLRVLSLPAAEWLWEQQILAKNPDIKFQFYGVERDAELNWTATLNAARLNAAHEGRATFDMLGHRLEWGQVLNLHPGPAPDYDIIYADYMGAWTEDKLQDVVSIFEGTPKLAKNGSLILTLSTARQGKICKQAAIIGETSSSFVRDPLAFERKSSRKMSQCLHNVLKGTAEQVLAAAADRGVILVAEPISIYYNQHQSKKVSSEASFCFHRKT